MAFRRSMITFRSPARPSPSMVIGKPSRLAVMVNLAEGAGRFDSMGVTLSVFVSVIGSSFLGDGGLDAAQEINVEHRELVDAEAGHQFVGQALARKPARPGRLD